MREPISIYPVIVKDAEPIPKPWHVYFAPGPPDRSFADEGSAREYIAMKLKLETR